MTNNLKKSIIKGNLNMGRPYAEDKREVRYRWPVLVADCLEEHREWVEKNWELIDKMARKGK